MQKRQRIKKIILNCVFSSWAAAVSALDALSQIKIVEIEPVQME